MFDDTFGPQDLHEASRKAPAFAAALAAHLLLASAAVTSSYMWIRPPEGPPPGPIVFTFPAPPPRVDPWRPPNPEPPAAHDRGGSAAQPTVPTHASPAPPQETPSALPAPPVDAAPWDDGTIGPAVGEGVHGGPPGVTGSGGGGGEGGGSSAADPMRIEAGIVPPVLLERVEPDYPVAARLARLQGSVRLEAVVATDGSVESLRVVSSTSSLFDQAAIDAVRRWRYAPARMNGRPVRVYFSVSVSFILK